MSWSRISALVCIALMAVACGAPTASRAPVSTRSGVADTPAVTPLVSASPTTPRATTAAPVDAPASVEPTAAATGSAAASPAGFDPSLVVVEFEPFVSGLAPLTFVTHAGDGTGQLYAVEQRGIIRVIEPDGSVREEPFLDISQNVSTGSEQGLLGLAFHPDYETNGRLFIDYTDTNGDSVVSELTTEGRSADRGSERAILQVDQPAPNHNGGMLAFGPDGYLYISLGDGGGGGDPLGAGQDLGNLLGSILRVDVDAQQPYAIPPDNPYADEPAARPEIWASGLRNPWRFSFDRQTGSLFIGDVGQGGWEEIDAAPPDAGGRNYGWNIMEGPVCYREAACDPSGLTSPVAAYARSDGRCAVTGGYVYRGERFPQLAGGYFFSDYCSGEMWVLDAEAAVRTGRAEPAIVGESGINPGGFGEDEAGELYLAGQGGEILRIVAAER